MTKYALTLDDGANTFNGTTFTPVRKLVICPEALRVNWKHEILTVFPYADVQIQLSGEEPHFSNDWTIIGYATVSKFLNELIGFIQCIFVDECHNCKAVNNWGKPTSKRAEAVIKLSESVEYCYLLSGTPVPSRNKDLFNILKMLKCESFDFNNQWAFKNFADRFCDPKDTYFGKDYTGNSNSVQLHGILNNLMVRRLKKDVLPNLTKQRQFIPICPKFKRDYQLIEKKILEPNGTDTYMGLAMTGRDLLSGYKLETAIDLTDTLLNAGESVVIVTNFNSTADSLKEYYKDVCCEIRGGMSDNAKENAKMSFQNKEKTVCILNMQAGGVGITLTAAHTMIIIDYAWVPSAMTQVEDRICRTGQTEHCIIYYIYCENSILDNTFIGMITDKSANIDTVVDNTENTVDLYSDLQTSATFLDALKEKIKQESQNTKHEKVIKKPKKKAS